MATSPKGKKGGSSSQMLSKGLVFIKHRRLICLLALLSLAAGLTYFVYAKPLYFAKSKVYYRIMDLPVHSESASTNTPFYRLQRALLNDLRERNLVERTAMRLGLVSQTGQYAHIAANYVPSVFVDLFDSSVLFVEVQAYSPELARIWTEAMIEEYKEYKTKQRQRTRSENIEAYMSEIDGVLQKLKEAHDAKFEFEKSSNFTETALEFMELSQSMGDLYVVENQIKAAERAKSYLARGNLTPLEKLARLDMYRKEVAQISAPNLIRSREGSAPLSIVEPRDNAKVLITPEEVERPTRWDTLREKHDEILHKRSVALAAGRGREHDEIKEFDRQLSLLDKEIESEVTNQMKVFENEYALLQDKVVDLKETKPEYDRVAKIHSLNQREFKRLDAGAAVWERAHKELKEKIDALEFGGDKDRIDIRYEGLNWFKESPVSPNKMKLAIMSVMLALALGVGVPIGLEHLNDTASKIEEIESVLDIPGLGIVPLTGKNELENIVRSPELDARIPNSLLENFRVIRSGIALNKELDSQVVMVTSARPSEGKTVNSCNLGWAFASLKEPTLIIDSDLRRGRVHKVLDISNEKGLSNFVTGDASLEEVVQKTKVPNLYAITRGPIIPGSTEQLCQDEYEAHVRDLRRRFARIIMDTPPVLGLSETASLMRLVDGVMLVIRAERTTHRDLISAVGLLKKAGAKFFGFVLNRLDLNRVSNYYNYYYYSSDYYEDMVDDDYDSGGDSDRRPPAGRQPGRRRPNPVLEERQPRQRPRPRPQAARRQILDEPESGSW